MSAMAMRAANSVGKAISWNGSGPVKGCVTTAGAAVSDHTTSPPNTADRGS